MKCKFCWLFIKFPFSYSLPLLQQKQRGACLSQKGSTGQTGAAYSVLEARVAIINTNYVLYQQQNYLPKVKTLGVEDELFFVQPPTVAFTIIPRWDGFKCWKASTVASSAVWDWTRIFVKKKIVIIHSQNIQNQAHYGRMICRTFKITVKHLKSQNTFASI